MANLFILLLAAGVGSRFGAQKPKQYVKLKNGLTILENSLKTLHFSLPNSKIILLISREDEYFKQLDLSDYNFELCFGGELRAQTVLNGLLYLKNIAKDQDWVLIQDAARTLTHKNDIQKLIKKVKNSQVGGLLATRLKDTIKIQKEKEESFFSKKTLDRNQLWAAQTPQIFKYKLLLESLTGALEKNIEITDEASCIEFFGNDPLLVESDYTNLKITLMQDLELANLIIASRDSDNSIKL